jgi:hypothetical protein
MDWLTFSVELTKALIWPLFVVVILIVMRKPLSELIPYLKKLKLGELEAEFEKTVRQIKDSMDEEIMLENGEKASPLSPAEVKRMFKLAEIAPNAAVLEAWKKLELEAKQLIARRGYELDYDISTPYLLIEGILEKARLIELKKVKVFRELRSLRNRIAHAADFEISINQAKEYVGLTNSLRRYLLLARKRKK